MKSRQIDKKRSKQVRINAGMHRLLKIKSAECGRSLGGLIEDSLLDFLSIDNNGDRND